MNNKKYIVSAQRFGAANAIIPVAEELRKKGNDVIFLAHNQAEVKCKELGVKYKTTNHYGVPNHLSYFNIDSMRKILESESPDYVLTGSSTEREWNGLEKSVILASQQMGIPNTMVVDLHPEAEIRFIDYTTKSLIIPEKVCVIDKEGKRLVVEQGIPNENVFVTGNPYFDMSLKEYVGLGRRWRNDIRNQVRVKKNQSFMFYVGNAFKEENNGYNDYDNICALDEMLNNLNVDLKVAIRLHGRMPDKEIREIKNYINKKNNINLSLLSGDIPSNRHLVFASDIVATATSTDGVTGAVVGKPVLSMMRGSKGGIFFTNEIGVTYMVNDYSSLPRIVQNLINDPSYKYKLCPNLQSFCPEGKAIKKIIDVLIKSKT